MMRWIHLEAGLLESVAEFSGVAGPPLFLVVGGGGKPAVLTRARLCIFLFL